jgi:NADH:ubiquinone oxidoreductase subunit F (NADH-binding)
MTTAVNRPAAAGPAAPARLLPAAPEDLRAHLARYDPVPYRGHANLLIADIEASGLTGRGGAAFPVHRKLALVARAGPRQGRKVVVANGAESEPASRKDEMLLRLAPNLVLDGLQLAAEAVGATEAHLYLHYAPGPQILRALAERSSRGLDRLGVTITQAPPRFLAGQEAAVVNRLGGGPALPTFQPPRVSERGLGGAPTLVQNVETLAHLALIARYGPRWFRAVGTSDEPGSMLITVYRPGARAYIREAAIGTPLRTLLGDGDGDGAGVHGVQAWLVGGYHGTWLPLPDAAGITLDNASLRRFGTAAGAGVLAALPSDRCGLTEAARVTGYLAAESAGQCGPCLNGLPRIAAALAELAGPGHRRQTLADLERWSGLVTGRGACHHPDGTVRFVRSALTVFEPEIRRHARGQCSASNHGAVNHGATDRTPFLPLPDGLPTREEDWT